MTNKGFTLWFTGLSGAGKTTLAKRVEKQLLMRGNKVELLDGDIIRTNLSKGLGFSKEDRDTNIRRIGFVCNLLARNGVTAVAAAISPYAAIRREVRSLHENFVEVFTQCSLDTLVQRDTKGLYKKALAGEIKGFTGVDDPYEEPENAEVIVDTDAEEVDESATKILRYLESRGLVPPAPGADIGPDEEAAITARLKDLKLV